jgi:hypothetical protein
MNAPSAQCRKATPQTPQATLMPDQGTMPISLRTANLAQGDELFEVEGWGLEKASVGDGDGGRERESRSVVVEERTEGEELGG